MWLHSGIEVYRDSLTVAGAASELLWMDISLGAPTSRFTLLADRLRAPEVTQMSG